MFGGAHNASTGAIGPKTSTVPGRAARTFVAAMNGILAEVFALYLKTKNFHWHLSGPHFRDCRVMLDEPAERRCRSLTADGLAAGVSADAAHEATRCGSCVVQRTDPRAGDSYLVA
jgi:hypothetical protein